MKIGKTNKATVWKVIYMYLGKEQLPEGNDKQSSEFYDSSAKIKSDGVKIAAQAHAPATSSPVQIATTAQHGKNDKSKRKAKKKLKRKYSRAR